jgi:tripartite-type tricarboxylate transporter receptor subunit TctC
MRKIGRLMIAALLVSVGAGMAFAQSGGAQGAWKWERKITFISPWGVGGGSGPVIRGIVPLVQDVIKNPSEIQHVEGAGGANGITAAGRQPADGYNFVMATQSIVLLDIQNRLPFSFKDEFVPVGKLVHSTNGIMASAAAMKGKFTDWKSLLTYIKAHPKEITVGVQSSGGVDQAGVMMVFSAGLGVPMNKVFDYIKQVSYANGSEMDSALLGGHIHLDIGGPGEMEQYFKTGDVVPLILLTEKRNSQFPDIITAGELGYDATLGQWRGIFARKGTPQAAIDAMEKALREAYNTPTYQQFCKEFGYLERRGFDGQADFKKIIEEDYEDLAEFAKAAGLIK